MKEEILQRIQAVLNTLDTITVSGKSNLGGLVGSMKVLEDMYAVVSKCRIEPEENDKTE